MITCSNIGFNGRLANQMFQFASTVGIGRKLGYAPKFPTENFYYSKGPHDYNGAKLLECFNIPDHFFCSREELKNSIFSFYQENSFSYNKDILYIPDNVDLNGYFQTEKYFEEIDEEIRKIFTFSDDIVKKAEIENLEFDNSVCVHVRRGDYLSSPDHHPAQKYSYYESGMNLIEGNKYYIFSDDPEWCKTNFTGDHNKIKIMEIDNPYVSLFLMSRCTHHIMSNSSLSWWASWLGKNENQVIVSPSNWFGRLLQKDTKDLYLKNSIIL